MENVFRKFVKTDKDCLNNPFFVKYFSSLTNVNFQIYFLSKSIFSFFQKNKMDNVLFSQQFVNIINLLFSTLLKASLSKEEKAEIYDILFSHPVKVYRLVEEQGKKPKWKRVKDKLHSDKNSYIFIGKLRKQHLCLNIKHKKTTP